MTSVAGSQWVTSSMWQPPRLFSPTLLPATDTLSAGQVVEIYQLATECQALGAELAKQFQNLSRLEAMHHVVAQARVHKTINVGQMGCNAAFSAIAANQPEGDCEKFLHQFCAEANQLWKDTNDIIFSTQLKYDAQLGAFITTAEETLQAKQNEIWSQIHSIAEVAGLPDSGLANSGQTAHSSPGPLLLHSHPEDVGLLPIVLCLPSLEHHGRQRLPA